MASASSASVRRRNNAMPDIKMELLRILYIRQKTARNRLAQAEENGDPYSLLGDIRRELAYLDYLIGAVIQADE